MNCPDKDLMPPPEKVPERRRTILPMTSQQTAQSYLSGNSFARGGSFSLPAYGRPDNSTIQNYSPLQQQQRPSLRRPPSPVFRRQQTRIQHLSKELFQQQPVKKIQSQADLEFFFKSEGLARILDFIMAVNDSIRSQKISSINLISKDSNDLSQKVQGICDMLDSIAGFVDACPPILDQAQRFGNTAFRSFIEVLEKNAKNLLETMLPRDMHCAISELEVYLKNSFGNGTRIDYGSGHELEFIAFLTCLDALGLFTNTPLDYQLIGLKCFPKYLELVRRLQTEYRLEPAGSHGVWGLDDYIFIAYIWGSSQLISHPNMRPKSILNREIVDNYSSEYIFLGCIGYVLRVKSGPFHEHSPMLYDISVEKAVPNWEKVNKGLVKMFIAEVLEKVPIVQHLEFGSLIPWTPAD